MFEYIISVHFDKQLNITIELKKQDKNKIVIFFRVIKNYLFWNASKVCPSDQEF